jgi:hypothetical protein
MILWKGRIAGGNRERFGFGKVFFRIVEQEIPEDENWEFRPGDTVGCSLHDFADGTALRAFKRTER